MSEQNKEYIEVATRVALAGAAVITAISIARLAFGGVTVVCGVVGVTSSITR